MYDAIYFNFKNRSLLDVMPDINNFLNKTSFEIVSVCPVYNAGILEVLIILNDHDPVVWQHAGMQSPEGG